MNLSSNNPNPRNNLANSPWIALKLKEFKEAWKPDSRPSIEEFVSDSNGDKQKQLIRELVSLEIELRNNAGETPELKEYETRFSELDINLETIFLAGKPPELDKTRYMVPEDRVEETVLFSSDTGFDSGMVGKDTLQADTDNQTREWIESQDHLQQFGEYVIVSEIARGGMGIVYKAYQLKLNRLVALKMISQGEFANQQEVRRFQLEAEAAAHLDHPGIVPVYDVGEHDGRHYFTMGLVLGTSLSDSVTSQLLSQIEIARIVMDIANAMSYAHSKGVIHRDLKPGNVLLDQKNDPRITDFGLAKRIEEDSNLTVTGQILGTPSYMPPEQATGMAEEMGVTADVYSIGAILYAMLCGRPPFKSSSSMATLKQVLEEEPIPPRKFDSKISTDLETICLKCLEKNRTQRYQSAHELAEELKRFREGRPITARPISSLRRFRRWCGRNQTVAGLIAAVVFTMILGSGFSIYFGLLAEGRAESAIRNERIASEQSQLALEALTTIIFDVNSLLREIPEAGEKRRKIVKEAIEKLEQVSAGFENSSTVTATQAAALINLADIYSRLGDESGENAATKSLELYKQSVTLFEQVVDVNGNRAPDILWKYSIALQRVASDLIDTNNTQKAKTYLDKCIELRLELANEYPDNFEYATGVIHAYLEEGEFWNQKSMTRKALDSNSKALELALKLFDEHPENRDCIYLTIYAHSSVGSMHDLLGESESAEKHLRTAFVLFQNSPDGISRDQQILDTIAWNRELLGHLYYDGLKDTDAAEKAYQEGIQYQRQAVDIDPNDIKHKKHLSYVYDALITFYQGEGRIDNLTNAMQERIDLRRPLVELDPTDAQLRRLLVDNYRRLADQYVQMNKYQEAIDTYLAEKELLRSLQDQIPEDFAPVIQAIKASIKSCENLARNTEVKKPTIEE
ncbi:serine/threonine-protein kinase [Polystyrenella longa]|uniref:serine/threonine-protein kinase n=1 Tax=Polystyrenella longa TaxID=2528007 RepID=UPI0018D2265E|nr:serine/threonine-protein kinase [Polystyrenella longa]